MKGVGGAAVTTADIKRPFFFSLDFIVVKSA